MRTVSLALLSLWLHGCIIENVSGPRAATREARLQAYLDLARGHLEHRNTERAHQVIEQALAITPRSSAAHDLKALILYTEGDLVSARTSHRRAIRLDRHDGRLRNNYGVFLYALGEYPEACRQLRLAAADRDYPGRDRAYENLGLCALQQGDPSAAASAFQQALVLNPVLPRALLQQARLTLEARDWPAARSYLTRFQEVHEETAESRRIAARLAGAPNSRTGHRATPASAPTHSATARRDNPSPLPLTTDPGTRPPTVSDNRESP